MKSIDLTKSDLEMTEECVHPTTEMYHLIEGVVSKGQGFDPFDALLVEGGLMQGMWDVWNGVKDKLVLTFEGTTCTVS